MVKEATTDDSHVLAEMAIQMWDSHSVEKLETEFIETLNNKRSAFFIKYVNDVPLDLRNVG